MKTNAKKIAVYVVPLAMFFVASCIHDEYKLNQDNLDLTISVGGEACALPLGTTDTLRLSSMLKVEDSDFLKVDADGNYHIGVEQSFRQEYMLSDVIDDLNMDGIESVFSKSVYVPSLPSVSITESVQVDLTALLGDAASMELELSSSFEDARQQGLVRLDSILMDNVRLSAYFECMAEGSALPEGTGVAMEIEVPERMEFEDVYRAGNVLELKGQTDAGGHVDMGSALLSKINYNVGDGDVFEFTDKFRIKSIVLEVDKNDVAYVSGKTIDFELKVSVGNPDDGNKLFFTDFYGILDIEMDAVDERLELGDIPEFLKADDVVLDFYAPVLTASISTNTTVPIRIDADLTPYFHGSVSGQNPVNLSFLLPYVTDDSDNVSCEYEWNKDVIGDLLKQIPDGIDVCMRPSVDDENVENHHVSAGMTSYFVDGVFVFDVPFSFGNQVSLSMTEVIELADVAEILGQAVSNASINLKGDVVSSFPVAFEMSLQFLDKNGDLLDIEVSKVRLESCASENKPIVTPLNISVAQSQYGSEMSSLLLDFRLLPGSEPGIMIGEQSFLQASLFVEIPGGIILDLRDFMEEDNNM